MADFAKDIASASAAMTDAARQSNHPDEMLRLRRLPGLQNVRVALESATRKSGQVAQLVEQWTVNPCVAGSIPALPIAE